MLQLWLEFAMVFPMGPEQLHQGLTVSTYLFFDLSLDSPIASLDSLGFDYAFCTWTCFLQQCP